MGDLESWLPHQNGDLNPPPPPPPPPQSPPLNPPPSEIGEERWRAGEKATGEVIEAIEATAVSERRRRGVVEYVQKLIRRCIGCEVFPFGSVPLKTYLPDGDIDLTAIAMPNSEDTLASNVRHVLETEEQNNDAELEVKDVQYIHAEVKLVKCLVENIVVDISFNQSGGLSTLCFLEVVDRMIGKDHLFKRSIILIKAWCYYESRILGAHHGLISTYALETLVLYIFHLFSPSLDGPLAVLYRFLDYYSNFDWDNFGISLYGPISVSSPPESVAEAHEIDKDDSLFTKEFLKNCVENFWVPARGLDNNSKSFPPKHLNIVDPLRENNNLGRSVSRGNFYRIRSAFTYGARKLGRILLLPSESISTEVNMFFANTMGRHGSGQRPDVQYVLPTSRKTSPSNKNGVDRLPPVLDVTDGNGSCEIESSTSSTFRISFHGSEAKANGAVGSSKKSKLADLTGDYEMHLRNLLYVQWSQEYVLGTVLPFYPQSSSYQYHKQQSWDPSRGRGSLFAHMNPNGAAPGLPFLPSGTYPTPFTSSAYGMEDLPKPRGIGTYFPNTNYRAYREKYLPGRGKNSTHVNYFSRHRNNGQAETPHDVELQEKDDRSPPSQLRLPVFSGNGHGKSSMVDFPNLPHSSLKETSTTNGSVIQPDAKLEFGSFGPVPLGALSLEAGRRLDSVGPASSVQRPSVSSNHERSAQAYQLKDEGDFPPLMG